MSGGGGQPPPPVSCYIAQAGFRLMLDPRQLQGFGEIRLPGVDLIGDAQPGDDNPSAILRHIHCDEIFHGMRQ